MCPPLPLPWPPRSRVRPPLPSLLSVPQLAPWWLWWRGWLLHQLLRHPPLLLGQGLLRQAARAAAQARRAAQGGTAVAPLLGLLVPSDPQALRRFSLFSALFKALNSFPQKGSGLLYFIVACRFRVQSVLSVCVCSHFLLREIFWSSSLLSLLLFFSSLANSFQALLIHCNIGLALGLLLLR